MKVFCKRTLFKNNLNFLDLSGPHYDKFLAFKIGKLYSYKEPLDYQISLGIYLMIECEEKKWLAIKKSEFEKHFKLISEHRSDIINELIFK